MLPTHALNHKWYCHDARHSLWLRSHSRESWGSNGFRGDSGGVPTAHGNTCSGVGIPANPTGIPFFRRRVAPKSLSRRPASCSSLKAGPLQRSQPTGRVARATIPIWLRAATTDATRGERQRRSDSGVNHKRRRWIDQEAKTRPLWPQPHLLV